MALKRGIIKWLEENKVGWSIDRVNTLGAGFVDVITDTLWYIDGHHDTLHSRSCSVPADFREFQGYNRPELTKHRRRLAENMCSGMLNSYSLRLNECLMQPWFSLATWKPLKECVTLLAESLHKYAVYLNQKNTTIQENHGMLEPVRSASEAESFHVINRARWVKTTVAMRFGALQQHINSIDHFVPVLVNDFAPADTRYCWCYSNADLMYVYFRQRRVYIDELKNSSLLSKILVYTYASGNHAGSLHFIWKIPEEISEEMLTSKNAEVLRVIKPSLPVYHTRAMKKQFYHDMSLFRCGKPAALTVKMNLTPPQKKSQLWLCSFDHALCVVIHHHT